MILDTTIERDLTIHIMISWGSVYDWFKQHPDISKNQFITDMHQIQNKIIRIDSLEDW